MDPDFHKDYMGIYAELDVRFPRILSAPVGKVLHGDLLWSEEERLASPVYHDNLLPFELYEVTGAQLAMPDRLSWLGFSLYEEEPWSKDQLAAQQLVLAHTRQALRIHLTLAEAQANADTLGSILTVRGQGVILLKANGKVVFANKEAETLQRENLFRITDRGLLFRDGNLNKRLAAALAALDFSSQAPTGRVNEAVSMVEGREGQIGIRFLPVPGGIDGQGTSLVVLCVPLHTQLGPGPGEINQFAALFRLTPAEEMVVAAITSGQDLALHCSKRGISLDTGRKHLKNAMAKANCRSQKDLLRLVERFCFFRLR
jgi:DNA-binding CsgD family transcriptional regulator